MRTIGWGTLALTLAAGCAARQGTGKPPESPEPLVLGAVLPFTGEEARFGAAVMDGIRLAVDEANRRGGVGGRQVEVRAEDSHGKREEVPGAFTRLAERDRPVAILGEVSSLRTLAMAPLADARKLPLVLPTSTNPRVTQAPEGTRPYVFRACFIDPMQGTHMARFAREQLSAQKAAALRDDGNDYSIALVEAFTRRFQQLGGTVVATAGYQMGDRTFARQLERIRASGAEVVYLPGYYSDVAAILREARAAGITLTFLGGDAWDSPELFQLGGAAVEGSYVTDHFSADDPSPEAQAFVALYRSARGRAPTNLEALGYDAARLVFDAVARAGFLDGPAVAAALATTRGFRAASGATSLDGRHDAVKPGVVNQVRGGAFRFVKAVDP